MKYYLRNKETKEALWYDKDNKLYFTKDLSEIRPTEDKKDLERALEYDKLFNKDYHNLEIGEYEAV